MPVCKYYQKGNCKFGDRCYYEHPRHSGTRNVRHDQYDDEWRDNNWRGTKPRQHHEQSYQSPMTQRNNEWRDSYSTSDSRKEKEKKYDYHHTYQDSSSSNHQYGYSNSRNDQYHWSMGQKPKGANRFNNLPDEGGQESETDAVIQTVKSDIKTWAGTSMWPFSCYSYAKGHACVEGLPDVSPEEMRVVFLLHRPQYETIWNELEMNYCKRKDELFEMNDTEKQALIAQMRETDSNPSEHLKLSLLYGAEYGFKKGPISSSISSTNSSAMKLPDPNPLPNPTTTLHNPNISKPSTTTPVVNLPKTTFSVFGTSSTGTNSNFSGASDIYTQYDDVNVHEKASFEAEKFVLGKIPIRPPPKQYCS